MSNNGNTNYKSKVPKNKTGTDADDMRHDEIWPAG